MLNSLCAPRSHLGSARREWANQHARSDTFTWDILFPATRPLRNQRECLQRLRRFSLLRPYEPQLRSPAGGQCSHDQVKQEEAEEGIGEYWSKSTRVHLCLGSLMSVPELATCLDATAASIPRAICDGYRTFLLSQYMLLSMFGRRLYLRLPRMPRTALFESMSGSQASSSSVTSCAGKIADQQCLLLVLSSMQVLRDGAFEPTSLTNLGLVVQLGHRRSSCSRPEIWSRDFMVVHTNGPHHLKIAYCRCRSHLNGNGNLEQLFRERWLPVTW
jgi:hypothetical protein